jgi:hypothetical protein
MFPDAFEWNWSKSAISDDAIFITSCINDIIGDETQWPIAQELVMLGMNL